MRKEPIYVECLNCGRNMLFIEGDVCNQCLWDSNTEELRKDPEYDDWLEQMKSVNGKKWSLDDYDQH